MMRVILQRTPRLQYFREEVLTDDGGLIHLDWSDVQDNCSFTTATRPTVLIMPGLTGDSEVNYVKQLVELVNFKGYRAVVFNNRGLGGAQLMTPRTFCPAYSKDVDFVIKHIKSKYPDSPLMAAGVSLGGILLLNYLAESQDSKNLIAAFVSSVGWDISKSMKSLEQPVNYILYNRHCTRRLQGIFKRNDKFLSAIKDQHSFSLDEVYNANSIRQIDQYYKVPIFGFSNIEDYYIAGSPSKKLANIKVPVLCINAVDDPFSPYDSIPLDVCSEQTPIALVITKYGGHIGFMEGLFPFGPTYSDKLFAQYVDSIFKYNKEL